jgi:GntR family transcriptional regulator
MPARYEEIANDLQRQIEQGLLAPGAQREATTSTPEVLIKQADPLIGRELGVPEGEPLIGRHQRRYLTNESGNPVPWSMQTSYYPFSFVQQGADRLMNAMDMEEGTMSYLSMALGVQQARYKDFLSVRPPEDEERSFFDLPAEGSVWVFVHRRTAYDTENRPCRYTLTVYPTDRNEFIIEAHLPVDGTTPP